jgi:hypothetical protein
MQIHVSGIYDDTSCRSAMLYMIEFLWSMMNPLLP